MWAEVGTCYFFRSALLLVCYLKIVLPLRVGPQLSNIWQSASASPLFFHSVLPQSAVPLFCYSYYHCSPLLLVLNSDIPLLLFFTEVYCILQFVSPQFAIPQFAIPQFAIPQFAIPLFAIPQFAIPQFTIPQFAIPQFDSAVRYFAVSVSVSTPNYLIFLLFEIFQKQAKKFRTAKQRKLNFVSALALVRYHFGSPLESGLADQLTKKAVRPPLDVGTYGSQPMGNK